MTQRLVLLRQVAVGPTTVRFRAIEVAPGRIQLQRVTDGRASKWFDSAIAKHRDEILTRLEAALFTVTDMTTPPASSRHPTGDHIVTKPKTNLGNLKLKKPAEKPIDKLDGPRTDDREGARDELKKAWRTPVNLKTGPRFDFGKGAKK